MFDNNNPYHIEKLRKTVEEFLKHEHETKPYGKSESFYPYTIGSIFNNIQKGHWDAIEHPIIIVCLQKAGFDGATIQEGTNKNYMVFKPNQIKSSLNVGTWDRRNPNINEKTNF